MFSAEIVKCYYIDLIDIDVILIHTTVANLNKWASSSSKCKMETAKYQEKYKNLLAVLRSNANIAIDIRCLFRYEISMNHFIIMTEMNSSGNNTVYLVLNSKRLCKNGRQTAIQV